MLTRILFVISALSLAAFAQGPPIEPGVSQSLAKWRAAHYSDVRYKLNLTLEKMSPVLKGTIEIRVNLTAQVSEPGAVATGFLPPIILDWRRIKGHEEKSVISNVFINSTAVSPPSGDAGGGARVPAEELNEHLIFRDGVVPGENVIKLDFTSPILTSGSAITRYIDKEDGSEYIYSLFVPSDASTAFPVFDQPDLKARFQLTIQTSGRGTEPWTAVSNTEAENAFGSTWGILYKFKETKPISTYVFAFAVGDFVAVDGNGETTVTSENVKNRDGSTTLAETIHRPKKLAGSLDTTIFLRKSQLTKFKPHAAEVFRLNREAIKYFEEYFDYKFPFPKYDLVLMPEFPFGGMEHAGATFLREASIIFPQEPTKSDHISRATLIFHEAAHQWFGDTVTMRWFDDLWLKEGFANFMAYKALEKIMPDANAWKVFYERIKQPAYATDSTKGTTPIYQPINNLNSAKSAYGNIVYNKAPAFLRQAEFYLGEDKFQTAVRAFLKKHEFGNAEWKDLVKEFESASGQKLGEWADFWVKRPGLGKIRITQIDPKTPPRQIPGYITLSPDWASEFQTEGFPPDAKMPLMKGMKYALGSYRSERLQMGWSFPESWPKGFKIAEYEHYFIFPNYQDYGYGIFLLDDKSREYVLKNVQNEKDAFLRSMMYGALWDSVREAELDPRVYVETAIKNLPTEQDETITQSVLSRAATAMNYYIPVSVPPAVAGGLTHSTENAKQPKSVSLSSNSTDARSQPPATAGGTDLPERLETVLIDRMQRAPTPGLRITYYRAFLNLASSQNAKNALKQILGGPLKGNPRITPTAPLANDGLPTLRTKDKFDIVTRLMVLGDADAPKLLAQLEKTETSDEARRYAYAARAGMATPENKAKYWNDFVNNKDISESWIEAAFGPFNSVRHSDLTLQYLQKALTELPNHKRSRKIFFVNGWLGAFIGGQRSAEAFEIINKFLVDNPNLDNDLRLKILENSDLIEHAVRIRAKFRSN